MYPYEVPPPFEPPPPLPPPPPGPPYRLRLWHFFLWTFASGLVAAAMRRPEYMRELTPAHEGAYLGLCGLYSLIAGPLVATSVWFLLVWTPLRAFRGSWPHTSLGSQPGHWLLLIGGMETVAAIGTIGAMRAARTYSDDFPEAFTFCIPAYLVGLLLAFLAWNRCTKDRTPSPPWSAIFWSGAVARMVCCLANPWFVPPLLLTARVVELRGERVVPAPAYLLVALIGLALLGVAVLADFRAGKSRDAFHWLGVAATGAILIYPLLWLCLLPMEI